MGEALRSRFRGADSPTESISPAAQGVETARERGTASIEYALAGVLVAIAFIAGATALGIEVDGLFRFVLNAVADLVP